MSSLIKLSCIKNAVDSFNCLIIFFLSFFCLYEFKAEYNANNS